jgi:oligosaccharyl transferase (archaeosortase A-associated)
MEILARLKERNTILILGILFILFVVVLYIRALPLLNLGNADILNIVGSDDPVYNLRLTEWMLRHYPTYAWFEAMTLFPTGQNVPWGPMLTWLTSTASLIVGASSRNEIIQAALWVPPILAAVLVPVTFLLVRKIWNWKAGLFAALFIAVVGGQFFFRSLAGYLDHHVAEVLFGTIFVIAYVYALADTRQHPIVYNQLETLKKPLAISILAGVAYVLGFLTMPTMILFAFIVALTTIVLFIVDFYHKKQPDYLLLINTTVFGIAVVVSLILSTTTSGMALALYTIAHPLAYVLLIAGTFILYALSIYLKGKNPLIYLTLVISLVVIGLAAMVLLVPGLYSVFLDGFTTFFGFNPFAATVQEARPWTLAEAWQTFNFGLFLMIGGVLVLLYKSWKEYRAEHIFVLVWSFFIIIAAFRQVRYEYYLAVNIAVLSGICVGYFLERAWPDIVGMGRRAAVKEQKEEKKPELKEEPKGAKGKEPSGKKAQKTQKETKEQKGKGAIKESKGQKGGKGTKPPARPQANYLNILGVGIVLAFALIFVVTSVSSEYYIASSGAISMNPDWRESLEWMNTGTPQTGVDYYAVYDQATFTYPDTAYGVMSWWDYGHMITYIAKRIPNANPFQAGVAGPYGAAAFFLTQNEGAVNEIADHQGTRYVMTDIEMDTGKFWAMATWYNSSVGQGPYQQVFLVPDNPVSPTSYDPVTVYTDDYFQTMVSRLHNFDGSMTTAGEVYYIEFTTTSGVGPYPVITNAVAMDAAEARVKAAEYTRNAQPGYYAEAVSTIIVQPVDTVPALQHYRLVHESPTNVFGQGAPADVKYVKIFEYVPGAQIKGEGIIELPIVTNTGREFTWRAESVNGVFTVPYATEGSPYDVRATGTYRIAGTGQEFSVSEEGIMSGATIN